MVSSTSEDWNEAEIEEPKILACLLYFYLPSSPHHYLENTSGIACGNQVTNVRNDKQGEFLKVYSVRHQISHTILARRFEVFPLLLKGSFHCLVARREKVLLQKKMGDRFIGLGTGVPRSACLREIEVILFLCVSTVSYLS